MEKYKWDTSLVRKYRECIRIMNSFWKWLIRYESWNSMLNTALGSQSAKG